MQEEKPVFAVIKLAVVPLKTSSKGAWYIVFTFVFILGTIDWYLLVIVFENYKGGS